MTTPNQQLMGMMSPQQARLLDDQLREQQIQNQSGGGMFSGAVAATLRGNDAISNAFSGRRAGVNEQANTDKRSSLMAKQEAEEKLQRERTAVNNNILVETDIKKLESIRDRLVERNTPEAAKSAKLAHDKIIKLKKELKESDGSSKLINDSFLPKAIMDSLLEEVASGVTKPQDVPKRIKESNEKVSKQMKIDSGIKLIESYGLTEADSEKYKNMLGGGVTLSDIVSQLEPKTDELTNQNLITMYRFFTPESVDAYKEAVEKGVKVTAMPKLVSLKTGDDGKLITNKPTAMQAASLKAAIGILAETNPAVEDFYQTAGIFGNNVDTQKVLGTTAQVYALANQKNITLDQAIVEYSTKMKRIAELQAKAGGS
jgi:hypothetical protein